MTIVEQQYSRDQDNALIPFPKHRADQVEWLVREYMTAGWTRELVLSKLAAMTDFDIALNCRNLAVTAARYKRYRYDRIFIRDN